MNDQERLIEILHRARPDGASSSGDTREENLRRLLQGAMPAVQVPESLSQRVLSLEAEPVHTSRPFLRSLFTGRVRWVLAALVLAGLLVSTLQPRWVAAQALRRIEQAITDVRSAHEVTWRVEADRSRVKSAESWYQGGKYRSIGSSPTDRTLVYTDGKVWHYDAAKNTLTIWSADGPFGYNRSGFSLKAMARDFARWGWDDRIRVQGQRRQDGRTVRLVTIERAGEPSRALLLVDAATDLPVRTERQRKNDGHWVTEVVTDHEYNQPWPESLFVPRFPASARVVDMVAGREQWEKRLAKGIARQRAGQRTIVLRDLQVNAQGDLFLLYTVGRTPDGGSQDWEIEITDDRGTQYRNGEHYQPYMKGNPSPAGEGFVFDGQRLEGNWWIPRAPQDPWRPRRFTITFHVAATPPSPDWKWPVGPDGFLLPKEQVFPAKARFTFDVERPTTPLVPEWMPYMAADLDEEQIQRGQLSARATMHRLDRDYDRALAAYQELARRNDEKARELGHPFPDPWLWMEMGELLRKMGRTEEARQALERAVRESNPRDSSGQLAKKALASLQAEPKKDVK